MSWSCRRAVICKYLPAAPDVENTLLGLGALREHAQKYSVELEDFPPEHLQEQQEVRKVHDAPEHGERWPVFGGTNSVSVENSVGPKDHLENLQRGDGDGGCCFDIVNDRGALLRAR